MFFTKPPRYKLASMVDVLAEDSGAPLTRPEHGRLSLCPDPEAQAHGLQGGAHEGVLGWAVLCGGRPPGHPAHPPLRCSATPGKMLSPNGTHTPEAGPHLHGKGRVPVLGASALCLSGQWDLGIELVLPALQGTPGPAVLFRRTRELSPWGRGSWAHPQLQMSGPHPGPRTHQGKLASFLPWA